MRPCWGTSYLSKHYSTGRKRVRDVHLRGVPPNLSTCRNPFRGHSKAWAKLPIHFPITFHNEALVTLEKVRVTWRIMCIAESDVDISALRGTICTYVEPTASYDPNQIFHLQQTEISRCDLSLCSRFRGSRSSGPLSRCKALVLL